MNIKNFPNNAAVVIPTFTNRRGLEDLLRDFETVYAGARVVLVNNGSDKWGQTFNGNKYNLTLIAIDEKHNVGFAKACNDGAKAAKEHFQASYLIFLNDDVRFTSDWLLQCINTMSQKKWFATAPVLRKPDGTIENYGYKVLPIGRAQELKTGATAPDGLTAAALVVKTNDFFKLKGFDERFFAYLEDIDLFLRAKKLGLKFGITKNVFVVHTGQQTSSGFKTKKAWLDFRNWLILIVKNWSREDLVKYFPGIIVERLRNLSGLFKSLIAKPHIQAP